MRVVGLLTGPGVPLCGLSISPPSFYICVCMSPCGTSKVDETRVKLYQGLCVVNVLFIFRLIPALFTWPYSCFMSDSVCWSIDPKQHRKSLCIVTERQHCGCHVSCQSFTHRYLSPPLWCLWVWDPIMLLDSFHFSYRTVTLMFFFVSLQKRVI